MKEFNLKVQRTIRAEAIVKANDLEEAIEKFNCGKEKSFKETQHIGDWRVIEWEELPVKKGFMKTFYCQDFRIRYILIILFCVVALYGYIIFRSNSFDKNGCKDFCTAISQLKPEEVGEYYNLHDIKNLRKCYAECDAPR